MNRMLVWVLVGSGFWCADGPTQAAHDVWRADAPNGDADWRADRRSKAADWRADRRSKAADWCADGPTKAAGWWSGIARFGDQERGETTPRNRSSRGGTYSFEEPRQEDSLLFVWWNLHNLFDTVANSGPRDRDFLPEGPYKWDSKRYFTKLYAVGRGLAAAAGGRIPDAIGVCEVENADVLDDLERRWPPAWRLWRLHRDSPDGRGIDVAVWYNPDRLRVDSVAWIHPGQDYPTREALWIRWKLPDGTRLTWLWLHLPSQRAPSPKTRADALADVYAQISTPIDGITGDLNEGLDGPLAQWLRAQKYRPHYPINLPGSFAYRGRLEALDGVWTGPSARWRVRCTAIPYGLKRTKNGYQIRGSFEGLRYRGGASDHLPLRMEVVRN